MFGGTALTLLPGVFSSQEFDDLKGLFQASSFWDSVICISDHVKRSLTIFFTSQTFGQLPGSARWVCCLENQAASYKITWKTSWDRNPSGRRGSEWVAGPGRDDCREGLRALTPSPARRWPWEGKDMIQFLVFHSLAVILSTPGAGRAPFPSAQCLYEVLLDQAVAGSVILKIAGCPKM